MRETILVQYFFCASNSLFFMSFLLFEKYLLKRKVLFELNSNNVLFLYFFVTVIYLSFRTERSEHIAWDVV